MKIENSVIFQCYKNQNMCDKPVDYCFHAL